MRYFIQTPFCSKQLESWAYWFELGYRMVLALFYWARISNNYKILT